MMAAVTDEVPGRWPVAINGVGYQVVLGEYQRSTLETMRQQADTSEDPGEQSLNPQDLWRRSQSDWRFGVGQRWLDREDSQTARSHDAFGVDVWERGEVTLLKDVSQVDDFGGTGTIGKAVHANDRIYVNRGDRLAYTADGTTWTETSTVPAGVTIRDVATDGFNVYLAVRNDAKDTGGIYIVNGDSDSPTKINNLIPDLVGFQLGRVMAAAGADVYNVTDLTSTDVPDPLTTLVNEQWTWHCFGEGPNYIYAAGSSGGVSLIYRFGIREDGTALRAGAVARQMPTGETVNALAFYRGIALIGTSKGVRAAIPQGQTLTEGKLIEVGAVRGFETQGDFVWFTFDEHGDDAGSAGIGRIDLSRFTDTLTPAYAPDLAAEGTTGQVRSVATLADRRIFVVEDVGVFYEDASTYRTSGWITSGRFTHRLNDKKVFRTVEARHSAFEAGEKVTLTLDVDDAEVASETFEERGRADAGPFTVHDGKGDWAEVTVTLAGDGTSTPTLTRWLVRSFPVPRRSDAFVLPLDLSRTVTDLRGTKAERSPETLFDELKALEKAGEQVTVQEWDKTFSAFIDQVALGNGVRHDDAVEGRWWQVTCFVRLRIFDGEV